MSVTNITNAAEGEEAGDSLLRDLKSTISELVQSPLLTTGDGVIPDCAYANRLLFTLENIINHGFQYNTSFFRMFTGGSASPFEWLERLPDCLPGTQYLIDTAKNSTQSSIARVRIFFRLALNDKTIHECIRALSWDQKWTASHYREWSIMRNPMQLTSLITKLEPLSAIDFKLMTVELVVPLARADYWSVANLTLPQKTEAQEDETAVIVVSKSSGSGSAAGSAGGKKKRKPRKKQQSSKKNHTKQQSQHPQQQQHEDDSSTNPFADDAIAEELGDNSDNESNGNAGTQVSEVDSSNPFASDLIEEELTKDNDVINDVANTQKDEQKISDEITKRGDVEKSEEVKKDEVEEEAEEEEEGNDDIADVDDVTNQLEAFLNQQGISSDDTTGLSNSIENADDLEALLNADDDDALDFDEGDVSDDINDLEEQLKLLTGN